MMTDFSPDTTKHNEYGTLGETWKPTVFFPKSPGWYNALTIECRQEWDIIRKDSAFFTEMMTPLLKPEHWEAHDLNDKPTDFIHERKSVNYHHSFTGDKKLRLWTSNMHLDPDMKRDLPVESVDLETARQTGFIALSARVKKDSPDMFVNKRAFCDVIVNIDGTLPTAATLLTYTSRLIHRN